MKTSMRSVWAAAALAAFLPARAPAAGMAEVYARTAAILPGIQAPSAPFEAALASRKPAPVRPAQAVPSAARLFTEPDDGRGPVLDVINAAQQSITLTIYEISDPDVVNALLAARQRGVSVQVLYNYYSFTNSDPNAATISTLQNAGVQVKPASQDFTVTHQKTLVADGQTAVIMSFNLQASYFSTSRDFGYVTSDPALVSEISRVFAADWSYAPVDVSEPSLVWSPVNSRQKITDVIASATSSLDIYNEELLDTSVLDAIAAAAGRGVQVRVLCPKLGSGSTDSNQAGREKLTAAGAQAKIPPNLYIHAKMVLADYGTSSARAYMGSENFSSTSLDKNRELGVLLTDGAMLSSLENTFQSDWNQ